MRLYFFLLSFTALLFSCSISDVDSDTNDPILVNPQISEIITTGWIYSELTFEGTALGKNCESNSISLTNGTNTLELDIKECTDSTIKTWIPESTEPGVYNISAKINGANYTTIDGKNMEVEVKNRPVILNISKTTMEDGETITIDGLHFLNTASSSQYDPKVWLMKVGYTNTASEITVDPNGKKATIIIYEGIEVGEYDLLITTKEWSNRIVVTII